MTDKSRHTQGAIRVAEIITGGKYGGATTYPTDFGAKSHAKEGRPMATNGHAKAVLYARFSSQPKDMIDTKDCDWQFSECRRFCRAKGIEVIGEHEDRGKGRATLYDVRPGLFAAVEATGRDTCMVAYKQDRIGSGTAFLLIKRDVESNGGRILTADGSGNLQGETPDMISGILALVDEHTRASIAARTSASMTAKQRAGVRMSGRGKEPWGTMTDPDDPTRLIPCPVEVEMINFLVLHAPTAKNHSELARLVTDAGYTTRTGGRITHGAIKRILDRAEIVAGSGLAGSESR